MPADSRCETSFEIVFEIASAKLCKVLRKRPASYRDLKPRNPKLLEENSKITPQAPDPNSLKKELKNTKNTQTILFSGIFPYFLRFFEEFGVRGPGGNF